MCNSCASVIVLDFISREIHVTERHTGVWGDCEIESCREAREILNDWPASETDSNQSHDGQPRQAAAE
jgi:hypothetical protein